MAACVQADPEAPVRGPEERCAAPLVQEHLARHPFPGIDRQRHGHRSLAVDLQAHGQERGRDLDGGARDLGAARPAVGWRRQALLQGLEEFRIGEIGVRAVAGKTEAGEGKDHE
ncbi:MAG: hypothetical protein ACREVJ_06075, partial [Gammaproteobacteria bacterium]